METNKQNSLSVTKFIAYQKYVHIKACLARRYVPRAGGRSWLFLYLHLGKLRPVSFMQKTKQKLVTRNIRSQAIGHVPCIYTHQPTIWEVDRTHNALCDYKYTRSTVKHEVTLELLLLLTALLIALHVT